MKDKILLKKLIEQIVNEELAVDEPDGGLLGKVAFSPNRKDNVDKTEEDTEEEDRLYKALFRHVNYNSSYEVSKNFDIIYDLLSSKKYEKILQPPTGNVYRFLYGLSPKQVSEIFGVDASEAVKKKDKAFVYSSNGTLAPISSDGIQSWTTNLDIKVFTDLLDYNDLSTMDYLDDDPIFLIAVASIPDGGKFLLNPNMGNHVKGFEGFETEEEVISKGPVKVSKIAIVVPSSDDEGLEATSAVESLVNSLR